MKARNTIWQRAGIGVIVGAGISAVDNFAFGGEVSPIVIAAMLLVFSVAAGTGWGRRAVLAAAIVWIWLPMAHVVKHLMGLPDTIHPNTYASILKLGAFTLVVTAIGLGLGVTFRRLLGGHATDLA